MKVHNKNSSEMWYVTLLPQLRGSSRDSTFATPRLSWIKYGMASLDLDMCETCTTNTGFFWLKWTAEPAPRPDKVVPTKAD